MIPQKFPAELLIQISEYLTPQEKRVGLAICRDWYEVFLYTLYRDIHIINQRQLNHLCKTLRRKNHYHSIPYGYLVKRLSLKNTSDPYLAKSREKFLMPNDVFEQLPTLCPYLELLDFDPESWKSIKYNVSVYDWKNMNQLPTLECLGVVFPILNLIGQGLTHLTILSSMIIDVSTHRRISLLLKTVPNLRSFAIKNSSNNPRPKLTITFEDVEAIHSLLPNLEELELSGDSMQMPLDFNKTTMDQISAVPTCTRMRHVHMNTFFTSAMWLFYVAHKYPYMKELILGVHFDADDTVTYNHTEFYTTLVQKCKQLLHLQLNCTNIHDWMNPHFFEALSQTCVQKIQPVVQSNNYVNSDSEFDVALQYGGRLITALEIAQWRLDKSLPVTVSLLKKLLHLSYLELKCDSYNDEYEMNDLLDSCPMLETLILEWGTLCITDNTSSKSCRHPLSNIRITYIAFDITFFTTLATYCPSLSKITISRCKQLYSPNNTSSQSIIKLDMPTLSLEYVLINGIRLDSSNASAFYHGLSSYVRIMSVEEARPHSKEEWYHHIGYKENDRKNPRLECLKTEEQNAIRDYFKKRENLELAHDRDDHLDAFGKQVKDNILKTNAMFGYVQLRCKSLENFVLDGNINCMFFFT